MSILTYFLDFLQQYQKQIKAKWIDALETTQYFFYESISYRVLINVIR